MLRKISTLMLCFIFMFVSVYSGFIFTGGSAKVFAAGNELLYEGETLSLISDHKATGLSNPAVWNTLLSDANASAGKLLRYSAKVAGDYVTYQLNIPTEGKYNVQIGIKTVNNTGIFQLSIDGENQGQPQDTYSTAGALQILDLGQKSFITPGDKSFRFTVTGKNPSSTGMFISLDYIKLIPVTGETGTPQEVLFNCYGGTDKYTTSDNIAVEEVPSLKFSKFNATAAGQYIEFTVPDVVAGKYEIVVSYRPATSRGICRLELDGQVQGTPIDQYDTISTNKTANLGQVAFNTSGHKKFRFAVTGKNSISTGYTLGFEYIKLVPVDSTGLTINQTQLGNVFLENESVSFSVYAKAESISWTVKDYWENMVASSAQDMLLINNEATLTIPLQQKGYFMLEVTANVNGNPKSQKMTPFAVLSNFTAPQDSKFGVQTFFGKINQPVQNYPDMIPLLQRLGVTDVRDGMRWEFIEPAVKGQYVFNEAFDSYMNALKQANLKPTLVLALENSLYNEGYTPYNEEGWTGFANYARALVERYGDGVSAVEVWNEYDLATYTKGPGANNPANYAEIIKYTYNAVKTANPNVEVIGGALTRVNLDFFDRLFEPYGTQYMDIVSVHHYPGTPYGNMKDYGYLDKLVKLYNQGQSKPIWVTETGWSTKPGGSFEEPTQAEYLVKDIAILLSHESMDKISWFNFMDNMSDTTNKEHTFGIIRKYDNKLGKYTPKPAYAAYAVLIRQLSGANFVSKDAEGPNFYSYKYNNGSNDIRVMWAYQDTKSVILNTAMPITVVDMMGNETLYQPQNGKIQLSVSKDPIYVKGTVDTIEGISDTEGPIQVGEPIKAMWSSLEDVPAIDGRLDDWQGNMSTVIDSVYQVERISPWTPGDISARMGVQWDDTNLYMAVEVTDDVQDQQQTVSGNLWNGDSIQIAIDPTSETIPGLKGYSEFGFALNHSGNVLKHRWTAPRGRTTGEFANAKCEIIRDDAQKKTFYEISIPWSELIPEGGSVPVKGNILGIAAVINDMDQDGAIRGWIKYMEGISTSKDPSQFGKLILEKVDNQNPIPDPEPEPNPDPEPTEEPTLPSEEEKIPVPTSLPILSDEQKLQKFDETLQNIFNTLEGKGNLSSSEVLGMTKEIIRQTVSLKQEAKEIREGRIAAVVQMALEQAGTLGKQDMNIREENKEIFVKISGEVIQNKLNQIEKDVNGLKTELGDAGLNNVLKDASKQLKVEIEHDILTKVSVEIPVSAVKELASKGVQMVLDTKDVVLVVPPSAVNVQGKDENTKIRISTAASGFSLTGNPAELPLDTENGDYRPVAKAHDFHMEFSEGNDSHAIKSFTNKVTISIPYELSDGVREEKLGAYWLNPETNSWEYVGGKIDQESKRVIFDTSHFSTYTVMQYDKRFDDVQVHWAKEDIEVLASRHIIHGVDENHFLPEANITRAEFAVLTVNALGLEKVKYSGSFADVSGEEWYANAIQTALNEGLIKGEGDLFRPDSFIHREEMTVLIMRAYNKIKGSTANLQKVAAFEDEDQISVWAKGSVNEACALDIIRGRTSVRFAPTETATRAEAATVLRRLLETSGDY